MKSSLYSRHEKLLRQFGRYFLVAGVGYLVDFGTLFILHDGFHVHYLLAAAAGFIGGLVVLYLLSQRFVFSNSKIQSKSLEIGIFMLVGIGGLGILTLLMWVLTSLVGINYLVSKVLATVVVYMWNFFARRALYHD